MSERGTWKINTVRQMIFEIFDPDTGLPKPSVNIGTLTVDLLLAAAVPGSPPAVTITELTEGRYLASFTPDALGYWYLSIRDPANNPQGWVDEFDGISWAPQDFVTGGSALLVAIAAQVAMAIITLPLSSFEVSIRGVRCLGSVVQRIRNKVARKNATTFAIYEQDNTTEAWTATVVTDAAQKPVISETPN